MRKNKKPRFQRSPGKKTVLPIVTVRIEDLSRAGDGVARDDSGRVIFIPYTAPGDLVKAKLHSIKSKYAYAECIEVVEPSPHRQAPKCPVFGRCGGCQWQHLPYSLQWETKASGVKQAFERNKLPVPADWDEFPATRVWHYRNRIQLRGRGETVGFYAKGTHDIVSVDGCDIAHEALSDKFAEIAAQGKKLAKPYKVELEVLPSGQVSIIWNAATASTGFQQINSEQNELLRTWVFENIKKDQPLLDLYGGSANLSILIAPHCAQVHCVDLTVPDTHPEHLPRNIALHKSDVLPWLKQRVNAANNGDEHKQPWSAIIDPPRGGMPADLPGFIDCLRALNVNELIAVGCKTDTWIRDLEGFVKQGWSIDKVAVFDFFPQTPHVEAAAHLVC